MISEIINHMEKLRSKQDDLSMVSLSPDLIVKNFSATKVVNKPWGFEIWIAYEKHLPYALKMLYIRRGARTSLQYHREKKEHIIVFTGKITIHYENIERNTIISSPLREGSIIEIKPPAVHRIQAITDVFLIEVSSNHLDDVVRLQDDYKRSDGKIESEHVI